MICGQAKETGGDGDNSDEATRRKGRGLPSARAVRWRWVWRCRGESVCGNNMMGHRGAGSGAGDDKAKSEKGALAK